MKENNSHKVNVMNIGTRSLTEILSMSHNNFVCEGGSRAGQKKKGQKLF